MSTILQSTEDESLCLLINPRIHRMRDAIARHVVMSCPRSSFLSPTIPDFLVYHRLRISQSLSPSQTARSASAMRSSSSSFCACSGCSHGLLCSPQSICMFQNLR